MGLFKDVFCAECGDKTKMLSRTGLSDGNYLCSKCMSIVPMYMQKSFIEVYELEDYKDFKKYVEFSNETLRPMFHETHCYENIHIDTENGIFCIDYLINDKTLFLDFEDVTRFDLIFKAEEFKEGMLGDKVVGKVLFELAMDLPAFYYTDVIKNNAKGKAKKKLFGGKIEFENPEGMDEFLYFAQRTWQEALEAKEDQTGGVVESETSELQRAMALFMIDDLKDISKDELKNLRNRLIKTFHPDAGESDSAKHAQKINDAYEIIKNAIE
ncbi:MAG: hypothetical protein J6K04_10715 [Lachnospiraceae bacterium]|nr:hypothetical protein [Lachnospiraceae bacterium]